MPESDSATDYIRSTLNNFPFREHNHLNPKWDRINGPHFVIHMHNLNFIKNPCLRIRDSINSRHQVTELRIFIGGSILYRSRFSGVIIGPEYLAILRHLRRFPLNERSQSGERYSVISAVEMKFLSPLFALVTCQRKIVFN